MTEHHYPDGSYDVDWTTPPTDDEREALTEDALTEAVARLIQQFEGDPEEWRNFRDAANAILASEVWRDRRQGPITGPAVGRAWVALFANHPTITVEQVRAALEAARDA